MLMGLMQRRQLLISSLIQHADTYHGGVEIVSRTVEGPIHRYTYRDAHRRARQLANALHGLGVIPGDRVATMAWNGHRHFELYYAVSGMGAVLHTINPRLFAEQVRYIINHAEDGVIFVDLTFVPLLESLASDLTSVRQVVILTDEGHMPQTALPNAICYETLLSGHSDAFEWPELDENTAAGLCYTSGTTGNPKGVLYSHRSTLLHSYAACATDGLGVSASDSVLPVVPMFHVNAWGICYAAAMCGAKLVLPGERMDGASIYELLYEENVTLTLGVPTVWLMLLADMEAKSRTLPLLERVVIGGSAAPRSMIQAFQEEHNATVLHAWGMTEMSPLGSVCRLLPKHVSLSEEQRLRIQLKQGRPVFGVEMTIVDDQGRALPNDGEAFGRLLVRGPWVASAYFGEGENAAVDAEGWFDTGDVSTIDPEGYMAITDRTKDVIKSGGEWISSIELENIAVGHPDVQEAAVIGVPHERWSERPLLLVVLNEGAVTSKGALLEYMADHVAGWQVPDDVLFVESLPHTATGKLKKSAIRELYQDYKLP